MAKVAGLEKSLKDKSKKEAEDLRFKFAKTESQKKFLKENPNVKTASEMKKMIADNKSAEQSASRMRPFYGSGGKVKGCKLAMKGKGKAYGKNS